MKLTLEVGDDYMMLCVLSFARAMRAKCNRKNYKKIKRW